MLLPPDNSIVLPPDGVVLDRTSFPIATLDEALALLPGWAREIEDAPLRDALLSAIIAMATLLWTRIGQSLGRFTSPALCDDEWLAPLWGVMLQRSRAPLESQGDYRTRLLAGLDVVTPLAIRAAVAAIEPNAIVIEPAIDCAFVGDTNPTHLACYVQTGTIRLRNDGGVVAAYVATVTSQTRPEFWVVLPPEFGILDDVGSVSEPSGPAYAYVTTAASLFASASFVGIGTGSQWQQLISEVESRRGHGVPWMAIGDPYLHTLR